MSTRPRERRGAVARLLAGTLAEGVCSGVGFRRPGYFWPVMTSGMTLLGASELSLGGKALREMRSPRAARLLALGSAEGLVAFLMTAALARGLCRFSWGRTWLAQVDSCTSGPPRALRAVLVVPAALCEELFWQGARRRLDVQAPQLGVGRGAAVSTLAYAGSQMGAGQPLPALGAALLGAGGAWLSIWLDSMLPALAAHLTYSELVMVYPGLPASDPVKS